MATEAVAHLGVIWALPSRPSAGLFLPSGITGQATWAGWLPCLNPFMWLPVGMGPTGVTPDGVGWPLPFLVSEGGSQARAGQTPFPLMASTCQPRHLWDLQGDGDSNGPVLLRVLPAGVGFFTYHDPKWLLSPRKEQCRGCQAGQEQVPFQLVSGERWQGDSGNMCLGGVGCPGAGRCQGCKPGPRSWLSHRLWQRVGVRD